MTIVFIAEGFNKKNVYDNGYRGKNAYVNGGAYNYIINGTYFAGYLAFYCALLVGAVILFVQGLKALGHTIGKKKLLIKINSPSIPCSSI
ncbi:MAG: hypothetical protein ACOX3W_04745 [Christensenellaceae bacterium]